MFILCYWLFLQTEEASPKHVRFHSNLLAGFGAGFITPVNTIDFSTVFDNLGQKLIDNVAVWATILAFIVIYIPFAVLARHIDKKDALKVRSNTVTYCLVH